MSEEIIKVLDALAEKFGLAVDWTSSNVIPYLNQLCDKYVNYEIVTSVVWLLLGIGFLFLAKWLLKKTKYFYNEADYWDDACGVVCIFTGIGCGIAIITGLIMIIAQTFDIVTCFTFPEKIIIEELKLIYTSMK